MYAPSRESVTVKAHKQIRRYTFIYGKVYIHTHELFTQGGKSVCISNPNSKLKVIEGLLYDHQIQQPSSENKDQLHKFVIFLFLLLSCNNNSRKSQVSLNLQTRKPTIILFSVGIHAAYFLLLALFVSMYLPANCFFFFFKPIKYTDKRTNLAQLKPSQPI